MFDAIWQDDSNTVRGTFDNRNVNTPDEHGVHPLQVACLKTYPDAGIVGYLMAEGASADIQVAPGLRLIDAVRASANPYQLAVLPLLEPVVELPEQLEQLEQTPAVQAEAEPEGESELDADMAQTEPVAIPSPESLVR
jgi:hypothetical protein